MSNLKSYIQNYAMHGVFLISLFSLLGSLYMSELEGYLPCPFCWWARVWMYPLVFVSIIAILTADKFAKWYVLTLATIGALFASYHNLLQAGVFTESENCTLTGTSCATPTIFTTIGNISISLELLSFLGFAGIIVLMLALIWAKRK